MAKSCTRLCICLVSLFCLLSCGLEDIAYIDNIPMSYYFDTGATIRLPSSGDEGYGSPNNYFRDFIIFYRIYISSALINTGPHLTALTNTNDRNAINGILDSDYRGLYPLTDIASANVNTSNLETTFATRDYFQMTLTSLAGGGVNIEDVLGSRSLGNILEIAFPPTPGDKPTLSIKTLSGTLLPGAEYYLQRAITGQGLNFNPRPEDDRSFLHSTDLCNNVYASDNTINADVAPNALTGSGQYTYVSMYIAAVGRSPDFATIYSQPTFIGIFRLTD